MRKTVLAVALTALIGCSDSSSNSGEENQNVSTEIKAGEAGNASIDQVEIAIDAGTFNEDVRLELSSLDSNSVEDLETEQKARNVIEYKFLNNDGEIVSTAAKPIKLSMQSKGAQLKNDSISVWFLSGLSLLKDNKTKVEDIDIKQDVKNYTVSFETNKTSAVFALFASESTEGSDTPDNTSPSPGSSGVINVANISSSSVDLSWSAASDDRSSKEKLLYKVVYSDSDNISSVADANANGTIAMDWSENALEKMISGLDESSHYFVNVLVKDSSSNEAAYVGESLSTLDGSAPTPGSAISFTLVTETSIRIEFGAASDNVTDETDLEYKIVSAATSAEIDTIAEAEAANEVEAWTNSHPHLKLASGLSSETSYCFAVLVRDSQNNMALYTPDCETTLATYRYIYRTSVEFAAASIGGISGADSICNTDSNKPNSSNYKAMLIASTRRACTTANCGTGIGENLDWVLKPNEEYRRAADDAVIGITSASAIFTLPLNNSFASDDFHYLSVNNDWTSSGGNCSNWTSNTGNTWGGQGAATNSQAIYGGFLSCYNPDYFFCVEQDPDL